MLSGVANTVPKCFVVKLLGHPVRTGQARRGRSTELTALSIPSGYNLKSSDHIESSSSLFVKSMPSFLLYGF